MPIPHGIPSSYCVLPALAVRLGPAEFDTTVTPAMSCLLLSSQLVSAPLW